LVSGYEHSKLVVRRLHPAIGTKRAADAPTRAALVRAGHKRNKELKAVFAFRAHTPEGHAVLPPSPSLPLPNSLSRSRSLAPFFSLALSISLSLSLSLSLSRSLSILNTSSLRPDTLVAQGLIHTHYIYMQVDQIAAM
jgi:hypothetical protein